MAEQARGLMRFLVIMLALCVEAGVVGALHGLIQEPPDPSPLNTGLGWALLVPELTLAFLFLVLCHELGHLFAGRLANLRFRSIAVGPIQLYEANGRFHWRFGQTPGVAGLVLMTPEDSVDVVRRIRLGIAGGPLASIAIALVVTGGFFFAGGSLLPTSGESSAIVGFRYFAFLSVWFLSGTLIPFRTRTGYATDMLLLISSRKGSPNREVVGAHWLLSREIFAGMPPREWTTSLIEQLRSAKSDLDAQSRGLFLSFYQALDRGDLDGARSLISEGIETNRTFKKENVIRCATFYEASLFASMIDHDVVRAQELFDSAWHENPLLTGVKNEAEAAIEIERQNFELATTKLLAAEKSLKLAARRTGASIAIDLDRVAKMRDICATARPESA